MRYTIPLLFFGLLSVSSLPGLAVEGFYLYSAAEVPDKVGRKQYLNVQPTPLSLSTSCTYFKTSRFGHVVTALHCIRDCLRSRDLLEEKNFGGYLYNVVKDRQPRIECGGYEVTLLGAGMVLFGHRPGPSLKNETASETELRELQKDYAVLRRKGDYSYHGCLHSRKTPIAAGEKVWSLGFPQATQRQNGRGIEPSLSRSMHVSAGTAYNSITNVPLPRESSWSAEHLAKYRNNLSIWTLHYGSLVISDADSDHGSSGGPVLDEDGLAVGLNVAALSKPDGKYAVTVFSAFYPIAGMKDDLVKIKGRESADQVFECRD